MMNSLLGLVDLYSQGGSAGCPHPVPTHWLRPTAVKGARREGWLGRRGTQESTHMHSWTHSLAHKTFFSSLGYSLSLSSESNSPFPPLPLISSFISLGLYFRDPFSTPSLPSLASPDIYSPSKLTHRLLSFMLCFHCIFSMFTYTNTYHCATIAYNIQYNLRLCHTI